LFLQNIHRERLKKERTDQKERIEREREKRGGERELESEKIFE
jgi:hypothetical protein